MDSNPFSPSGLPPDPALNPRRGPSSSILRARVGPAARIVALLPLLALAIFAVRVSLLDRFSRETAPAGFATRWMLWMVAAGLIGFMKPMLSFMNGHSRAVILKDLAGVAFALSSMLVFGVSALIAIGFPQMLEQEGYWRIRSVVGVGLVLCGPVLASVATSLLVSRRVSTGHWALLALTLAGATAFVGWVYATA